MKKLVRSCVGVVAIFALAAAAFAEQVHAPLNHVPMHAVPDVLSADSPFQSRSEFLAVYLSSEREPPIVTVGPPSAAVDTLWVFAGGSSRQAYALELSLNGSFEILEIAASPGVLNLGSNLDVHLVHESASPLPEPCAFLVVRDSDGKGAEVCMWESSETSRFCIQDYTGTWYNVDDYRGFTTASKFACAGNSYSTGCGFVSVDSQSWGRMKAAYR